MAEAIGGLRQVSDVQSGQVLAVSATVDVLVGGFVKEGKEFAFDIGEIRYHAVVHDSVSAKYKRMVVDGHDGRCCGGSDMSKTCGGRSIGADTVEVVVVCRGLAVLVHGGAGTIGLVEGRPGGRVPDYSEAIDIVEAIAEVDLGLAVITVGAVRDEFGQVVVVDLLR